MLAAVLMCALLRSLHLTDVEEDLFAVVETTGKTTRGGVT
jgi:hypothetical protein